MSRWKMHRMFEESIPTNKQEAHVFLDNAFKHAHSSGADSSALFILVGAMAMVEKSRQEAA